MSRWLKSPDCSGVVRQVSHLHYLILGRGGRTDELKEELNRIREQVEHIMRLL